jgi:tRNA G18 (ribose-2'-O)-methylase SpoU
MKESIITKIPSNDLMNLARTQIKFDTTGHDIEKNVIDEFKDLSTEEIKNHLKNTAFPYSVLFENWIGDFNLSTGIRNANAFNASEILYMGRKRFDKRGAVGTYNYKDVSFIENETQLLDLKKRYSFIGIDNIPGSVSMKDFIWPKNTLMIFGEEGKGLSQYTQSLCDSVVYIEQFGSVRSVNCGTASGITMVDFVNKFRK